MGFGLSFGSNKAKTSTNTTATKDEATTQATQSTQTQSGSSASSTSSTGSSATTGSQQTATSGTSQQQTTGTQQQVGTTTSFSDQILSALESAATSALGGTGRVGPSSSSLSSFDPNSVIEQGYQAAQASVQADLEKSINGLTDSIGGTSEGNSMAALLANRLRGDAAANLAGVRSNLTQQAYQTQQGNVAAATAETSANQAFAANLLQVLRGGVTTSDQSVNTSESQVGATQNIGEQQNQQQTQQQQQQQTQTIQELTTLLSQLMTGKTSTVGTEVGTSTTKKSGGGFGLSI